MAFDLSAYPAIETALFVRIDVPDFEILRFSNFNRPYTIDGESYTLIVHSALLVAPLTLPETN